MGSQFKDYPEIVYKYRDWVNKFNKNVLIENELYLSSPADFNDPFDCRIPSNYFLLNTPEKKRKYADIMTIQGFGLLQDKGLDIEKQLKQLDRRLNDELPEMQAKNEKLQFAMQDIHFGVLSLSARWDSILMWSHYANYHKGYCIGFWEEKLRNSRLFGNGGPVLYPKGNKFPEINPIDNLTIESSFKQTHVKAHDWEYEKEYRLTKLFYPEEPSLEDRIIKIPNNYIAEVLIGFKASNETKSEIINIAKEKNIAVFEIEAVPFKFEVTRKRIV